jgi:hypothetical protein
MIHIYFNILMLVKREEAYAGVHTIDIIITCTIIHISNSDIISTVRLWCTCCSYAAPIHLVCCVSDCDVIFSQVVSRLFWKTF